MGLIDSLKSKYLSNKKEMKRMKMLSGYSPVFSQFGQNIYTSDVVQNCIDIIATEISKLQPKHIKTDSEGIQSIPRDSINRLFKFAPNELMITRDFLEKIIWSLYMNYNAFILPVYTLHDLGNGNYRKEYTAFYPISPSTVEFIQDENSELFVKLYFANGEDYTIAYSDIIHLRKKFSVNGIMGGGFNGQPDNQALLKVLTINDTVLQGLEKGIKTSLSIRGVLKVNTLADDEKQEKERKRLEDAIEAGTSGIITMDLKGEYIPLNPDPKMIDKDTLDFLQNKILNWYGVSVPIFTGGFSDEEYQAFYEKTLEPILISLGQAFSKTIFTQRELDVGNEIVFYQKDMMYLSTNAKLNLLKTAGEQGLLTDNQKLALIGYSPLEDGSGNRRTQSLNYVDVSLINAYQMKNSETTQGGKS